MSRTGCGIGFLDKFLPVELPLRGEDIGSIMMLDNNRKELRICASKGLSEDIVKESSVNFGEGISGTAVRDITPFLIDSTYADSRIKKYLNRPQIKSSMVLPIKINDTACGVMNLGTLETSQFGFNKENMASINELIELASLALHK